VSEAEKLAVWCDVMAAPPHSASKSPKFQQAAAELRRLAAENAALRKNAERYRWLRNYNPTRYAIDLGANIIDINCKEDGQYELDAAIDSVMQK
jgi:hypothetical protein